MDEDDLNNTENGDIINQDGQEQPEGRDLVAITDMVETRELTDYQRISNALDVLNEAYRRENRLDNLQYMPNAQDVLLAKIFSPYPCYQAKAEQTNRGIFLPSMYADTSLDDRSKQFIDLIETLLEGGYTSYPIADLDFTEILPGYKPETTILFTRNQSVMKVVETQENGAPVNRTIYYSWDGGTSFYNANPNLRDLAEQVIRTPRAISMRLVEDQIDEAVALPGM